MYREGKLLKAKLHLAEKRVELLKDKAYQDSLTMHDFQSKLSLSKAMTHAAKGKLQWQEKKAAQELSEELLKASRSTYEIGFLECKRLVKQILPSMDAYLLEVLVIAMSKALLFFALTEQCQ